MADDLGRAGLVEFSSNPDHARAKLMRMTAEGQKAYAEALRRQGPWAGALAKGFSVAELAGAERLLVILADRLNEDNRNVTRATR